MRNRILYSQNFLRDKNLINKLLDIAKIPFDQKIIEIGSGNGIITEELVKRFKKVIAFEIDVNLYRLLKKKFDRIENLEIKNEDFLDSTLPNHSFSIFSNVPFNISSSILKKITEIGSNLDEAYLVVQKETSLKFAGIPYDVKNSQVSVLLYPFYEIEVIYQFNRTDFMPIPNVDIVMMKIKKRKLTLISSSNRRLYNDFVTYKFTRVKTSKYNFSDWIRTFNDLLNDDIQKRRVIGSYEKLVNEQNSLEKINRTRLDKNWKHLARINLTR